MKELQLIRLQEEHINQLQKKLKERKREFIDKLVRTPKWAEFLLRHTKTYYRPRNGVETLKSAIHGGKFSIEFPENNSSIGKNTDTVQIGVGYAANGINFRTFPIPIDEVETFVSETDTSVSNKPDDYTAWYWLSSTYTVV